MSHFKISSIFLQFSVVLVFKLCDLLTVIFTLLLHALIPLHVKLVELLLVCVINLLLLLVTLLHELLKLFLCVLYAQLYYPVLCLFCFHIVALFLTGFPMLLQYDSKYIERAC